MHLSVNKQIRFQVAFPSTLPYFKMFVVILIIPKATSEQMELTWNWIWNQIGFMCSV